MIYSIIIPVYNAERWLPGCLESIQAQTLDSWQVVLVDDGSTDGSPAICDAFVSRMPERALAIHQKNEGPLAARRAGLRASIGDVVIAVDSDDMLRPDALEKIDSIFARFNVDLVVYGSTRKSDYSTINPHEPFGTSRYFPPDEKVMIVRRLCVSQTLNSMCAKAVRREFVDMEADYSTYGRLNYAEDLLQSLPIIDAIRSSYYIHEPLYFYRVNYASLTKRFDPVHLAARETVRDVQFRYAEKWADEFDASDLINGVRALRLQDYAEVAQSVSESLSRSAATAFLHDLIRRTGYQECRSSNYRRDLRGDFAIIVRLLDSGHHDSLWVFCRLKGRVRRMLGR